MHGFSNYKKNFVVYAVSFWYYVKYDIWKHENYWHTIRTKFCKNPTFQKNVIFVHRYIHAYRHTKILSRSQHTQTKHNNYTVCTKKYYFVTSLFWGRVFQLVHVAIIRQSSYVKTENNELLMPYITLVTKTTRFKFVDMINGVQICHM